MIKGDYETVARYTHPMVAEGMGGRDKIIEVLKKGSDAMASEGTHIELAKISVPVETIKINQTIYSLVPEHIEIKISNGRLLTDSYLLGILKDQGDAWYFVDTAKLNNGMISKFFPDLVGRMKIPERKKSVFIKQ